MVPGDQKQLVLAVGLAFLAQGSRDSVALKNGSDLFLGFLDEVDDDLDETLAERSAWPAIAFFCNAPNANDVYELVQSHCEATYGANVYEGSTFVELEGDSAAKVKQRYLPNDLNAVRVREFGLPLLISAITEQKISPIRDYVVDEFVSPAKVVEGVWHLSIYVVQQADTENAKPRAGYAAVFVATALREEALRLAEDWLLAEGWEPRIVVYSHPVRRETVSKDLVSDFDEAVKIGCSGKIYTWTGTA